jgi:EF-P beta-lysylation protein EpmB
MALSIVKSVLWRQIQKENFTSVQELAEFLELSEENKKRILKLPRFVLNLPRRLAAKMAKNDLADPLFRQFVPLAEEELTSPGFVEDPVCDASFRKEKKLLHKYHGRALWLTTSACAMNCRYCFRQNFPYESSTTDFKAEINYLRTHTDIKEIILSGGDPLSLSDGSLMQVLFAFDSIPHLQRIRFHTRFPIGIPERIDRSFLELLSGVKKQIYFVIHCNHPKELDPDIIACFRNLSALGIPILNQSVLLKGVNDDEKTFLNLCESLVDAGVIPYYLHQLDPVAGSHHFFVPEERGRELIRYVQEHLSGYGVPRLVREIAGASSKTFL